MKSLILSIIAFFTISIAIQGQELPQNSVPSVVVKSFQKSFPNASDIEWEQTGSQFKVEFETGIFGNDHSIIFDKAGNILKHKEEISKNDLPIKVVAKIKNDYANYNLDDINKITKKGEITYIIELKSMNQDWEIRFDADGNEMSKVAD